ncbi:MAG: phosphatidylserine decarboxylase family protein [Bacteroidia bacterium]
MFLHREGFATIFVASIVLIGLNYLSDKFIPNALIKNILVILSLFVFIIVLQFFRNPTRKLTQEANAIVAPADGKVVVIEKVFEKEYLKTECMQISIFMSPLNVHVNRNPIGGIVKYFKYHPGKYLVAWHPKSSELNERTTTVIETERGDKILFRQIAGALARRICWYVKEGQPVKQAQEMGFIKFGSRVDVFIPLNATINVKIGEKTSGGQSIIAQLR